MPIYALGDERARIHPSAFVHPEAVLIGEVHLGPGSSVWPCAVIRADNGPILIGARTSIQDGAVLHTQPSNRTIVGDECTIGHLAHLEGCRLEDLVLVGTGAIVLEQSVCRRGSFVASGALVPPRTEVPPGVMAIGVPAKLRHGVVTEETMRGYAEAYQRHLVQHRDGMSLVELAACLTEEVGTSHE